MIMVSKGKTQSEKGGGALPRCRWLIASVVLGAAVLAAGLGVFFGHGAPALRPSGGGARVPEPPSLAARAVDPAVLQAVQAARAAVVQAPHSAPAWGRLGMILKAHQFNPEASACFVQAEQLDPREPRWPYHQGIELAERDPELAVAKLRQAVALFGNNAEAPQLRLAELLIRLGRLDEAGAQLRRLLQHDPDHGRAHLDLARVALEQDDLQASLDHLRHARNDQRSQKAACSLAAEVYQRLGHAAAAEQQRHQAAGLPDDPPWPDPFVEEVARLRTGQQVRLARADWLLSQGRQDEAIAFLHALVRDYPDSDWAWLLLGRAFLAKKDLPAAEAALRKAAHLKAASMEVQFYLGVVLLLRQDPGAAASCFRKATVIKPDFAEAYHNLGHCLLRQGDRTGAAQAFRKAILCKPHYGEAHRDLADLLAQNGEVSAAVVQLGYALQLNPADAHSKKLAQQLLPRVPLPTGP